MNEIIKIRHFGDMWWTEIKIVEAMKWSTFSILIKDDDRCFVNVENERLEMSLESYDKVMNNKAFKVKFGLKKHEFNF